MLSAVVLVGGVFCSSLAADAAGLVIADGGRSDYTIVVAADASASEKHGAKELQMFLQQISGATLPIASDTDALNGPMILVGRSTKVEALAEKIDFDALGDEGFVVRTAPPHLVLAGGRQRGTLYAVYTFLENHLGCRWFTPTVSRIPKQERIELGAIEELQGPPTMEFRSISLDGMDLDWAARNKLNAGLQRVAAKSNAGWGYLPAEPTRGGGRVWKGAHTYHDFLPSKEYFEEHPEYFALTGGERKTIQICLTHPEVVKIVALNIKELIRETPKADIISLSQNDGFGGYCTCPACKAIDDAEGGPSGTVITFVNQVADIVGEEFPDVAIGTMSYLFTKTPPKTVRPRPNVVVMIAPIQNCFSHPAETCDWAHVKTFRDDLAAWSKLSDRLYVWDYVICFHHLYLPFPNLEAIQPNIKLYADSGIHGILNQGDGRGEMKELRNYMLAKCMWNPATDARKVRDDFLEGYYGPAAGPINEYLDMIHQRVRDDNIHMYIWAKPDDYITPEILSRARELFDEAERRVEGQPDLVRHVEMARLAIQYAELCRPSPFVKGAPIYAKFKSVVEREKLESYGEGKAMDGWLAEKGATYALAEFEGGNRARGLYGLESALSISPKNLTVAQQLHECRRKVFPDLLTYGSVDAYLAVEVLVPDGAVWRYFPGKEAPSPGLEWAQGDFDDQAWQEGKSGFGYGDGDDATVLDGMQNTYTSLYIRRSFDVADPGAYENVVLSVSVDDGFIAYLNGVEVGRSNVPDPSPGVDGIANLSVREPLVPVNVQLSPRQGRNILALHGLNRDLKSSDFSLAPAVKAASRPGPERSRPLFEAYLASVPKPTKSVAAYFEGQVLASEGKHREAAEKFRLARELDPSRREPFDRLLESLRASGQMDEAERLHKQDLQK
jgi:hypothetical protein